MMMNSIHWICDAGGVAFRGTWECPHYRVVAVKLIFSNQLPKREMQRIIGLSAIVAVSHKMGVARENSQTSEVRHELIGSLRTPQCTARRSDSCRYSCISNIRPGGIGYADAAFKLAHLLRAMRVRGLSGVALKDDSERRLIGNSLLAGS